MTPEQIEKWRAEADAYAAKQLPDSHLLSMRYRQIRDTEFRITCFKRHLRHDCKAISRPSVQYFGGVCVGLNARNDAECAGSIGRDSARLTPPQQPPAESPAPQSAAANPAPL